MPSTLAPHGKPLTHALVRPPATTFAQGLTTVDLGKPDVHLARRQHDAYCSALLECGLSLTRLPADPAFPDGTFVEDTAVVLNGCVVLTRPGAASRRGETAGVRPHLPQHVGPVLEIVAPGSLDGGDVCVAGQQLLIGLSTRTNQEGARQLAQHAAAFGYTVNTVDIGVIPGILHLKSGVVALEPNRLVVCAALERHPALRGFELEVVDQQEAYAANCVQVNGVVLLASGFPRLRARLEALAYRVMTLDMSEFQKMDGGLTCLSLRW
jgi:dimethylargininase